MILHHDADSQYTALRFTNHLALEGMHPSIGSVEDAYDNYHMESIIGLYRTECICPGPFVMAPLKTVSDVEYATMVRVDWYNTRRLHSSFGNVPPAGFEVALLRSDQCTPDGGTARMKTAEKPLRFIVLHGHVVIF